VAESGTPSLFDRISAMADELKLEGDDKDNFVNQAMERAGGHKKVVTWVPDAGDGKGDKDGKKQQGWFPAN